MMYMHKKKGRVHKYGSTGTFMGGVINPKGKFDLREPYKKLAKKGNKNPLHGV